MYIISCRVVVYGCKYQPGACHDNDSELPIAWDRSMRARLVVGAVLANVQVILTL